METDLLGAGLGLRQPWNVNPSPHAPPFPDFLARRVERYYRERVRETWDGGHLLRGRIPGKDAVQLQSNDYLAVASHSDILEAQTKMLSLEENGMLMSAVFLHEGSAQRKFEKKLAKFMQAEEGMLCQSGYCANVGLIQSIADEDTPVYVDMFAHMSLWEGVRSAGAKAVAFYHNDPGHLERQILKYGPGVVVVDSVYSTNGSLCPLREIVEVANSHGCALVVDESHSLGTHGENGEGLVASLGLSHLVHFRTASLAKAFAGRAGFITGPHRFYDYFGCEARPFIFSSALLPYEIAGLEAALGIIEKEKWRREKLQENSDYLRSCLDELGYNVDDSQSQIISLESGPERQTMILRNALEKRGIFGAPFFAPATPKNRSLIRFSVNSALTEVELERIVEVCAEIREEVDLENWASTRRKRQAARA